MYTLFDQSGKLTRQYILLKVNHNSSSSVIKQIMYEFMIIYSSGSKLSFLLFTDLEHRSKWK